MLDIEVLAPIRTDSLYEFRCNLRPQRSLRSRFRRQSGDTVGEAPSELRFGFRATNFEIAHHEVWDGLYPLFFLTRNGGPLFNKGYDRARFRFEYAIPAVVRDFYIRRAADFGIEITVEADTNDVRLDQATSGDVVPFGGGKDSRLLLGLLRELGHDPLVITAKAANATDIPGVLVTESIHGALADRLMPSLMALRRTFWFGGTIGEAHLETPWQQYYDLASPGPRAEWEKLFTALGVKMHIVAPLTVLPYHVVQRMLHDRYPDLYAHQTSTRPGATSEKSLHIALLKIHCGYPFEAQHDDAEFQKMLRKFVRLQTADTERFGYRDYRRIFNEEMRAIIWRHRAEPLFAEVRDRIPPDWDTAWIDYVHPYMWPASDPQWLAIFHEYAPDIEDGDAASDEPIPRIPI